MAQYGTPDAGILGMLCQFDNTIESFIASGTVTPGRPVYSTPGAPTVCHESYSAGDYFVGIAMISHKGYTDQVGIYADKDNVNVLSDGRIYVQAGEAISTAPVAVYANTTSKKFELGASGNAAFGAVARGNASNDGILEIEVHAPVLVVVA